MSKKLSEQELQEILSVREGYNNVIFSLGDITAQIFDYESKLALLNDEKLNYLSTYSVMINKEKELSKVLSDKYGPGQINLDTGEIS